MKLSLVVSCVLLAVLSVTSNSPLAPALDNEWLSWKSLHGKQYMEDEEINRRMIWEENMRFIEKHNLEESMGQHTFTVGMNQFGDLTNEEYKQQLNSFDGRKPGDCQSKPQPSTALPQNVDWRIQGFVTPVKDQGSCSSSWAFSATGAIEGQVFKKTKKLIPLSEQNLIDCDAMQHRCGPGSSSRSFQYVKIHGLNSEEQYPYMARVQICNAVKRKVARCKCCVSIQPSELDLAAAVASVGPISVEIDGSPKSFQLYKKGIYHDKYCTEKLSHAMLVVGYGINNQGKYWIAKNSYGKTWGDEGYIYMAKDMKNHCGIANNATYPKVKK